MHKFDNSKAISCRPSFDHHDHVVQFYETEGFLYEAVGPFLADGLNASQGAIVIATPCHAAGIRSRLTMAGFDVLALEQAGRLTVLDAREALATFMVDGVPDEEKFRASIGPVIERSRQVGGSSSVRAYGEMVDVLLQEGQAAAAIRLEQLWNNLASVHAFALLCAYSLEGFKGEAQRAAFDEVCRAHGQVMPTEAYLTVDTDSAKLREIAYLQQRARALETELAYRKELERALREALSECERIEAEREVVLLRERAARADAETANRLKDDFLAVVSHEMRTPLNAIVGWAQILSSQPDDEALRARAIEVILRNAALQQHVVDDLLDVSRIMVGKMEINSGPVDLIATVRSAIESVRPNAAAKAIELDLEFDESARTVDGDAARLQQVVWNLLSNAIKFTPEGGRVAVRVERADAFAEIAVVDTGQGIAADFLPHIFDRFRQADTSSTRTQGGLGLGLSVVRHLVDLHGGTVAAFSDGVGCGTTVRVRLPLLVTSSAAIA